MMTGARASGGVDRDSRPADPPSQLRQLFGTEGAGLHQASISVKAGAVQVLRTEIDPDRPVRRPVDSVVGYCGHTSMRSFTDRSPGGYSSSS